MDQPDTKEKKVEFNPTPTPKEAQYGSLTVGVKTTLMPQQYCPVQIHVEVTIPCKAMPEAYEKTFAWADKFVEQKLQAEIAKVKQQPK